MKTVIVIFCVVAFLMGCYLYYKRKVAKASDGLCWKNPEVLNGMLRLADVQAYFKSLSLSAKDDNPFVADLGHEELRTMLGQQMDLSAIEIQAGWRYIVLGVLRNDTPEQSIIHTRFVQCRAVDPRLDNNLTTQGLLTLK